MSQIEAVEEVSVAPKTRNSIKKNIMAVVSNVSVEPSFLIILFSSIMYQISTQNLYLEKACRVNIGFDSTVCDALTRRNTSGYTSMQEIQVQKLVSQMFAVKATIQGFFPVCLIIFVGSWSDRHNRRKPLIIAPAFGDLICCSLLIVNVVFFHELPLIFTVLGDCLPLALFGGWPCLFLGVYSYIGSRTSTENRTVRIGIVAACQMMAFTLGTSVSGIIFQSVGFIGAYIICLSLFLFAIILCFFLVREDNRNNEGGPKKGFFKDFLNVKHFANALRVCFKNGPNKRRLKMFLLMLLNVTILGPLGGELTVLYLYMRRKFGFDEVQFGFLFSINFFVSITGVFIVLIIFTKMLKWEDSTLGIISHVGAITSHIVFAFAPTPLYFLIGSFCDIFHGASHTAMRSLLSKLVPASELAQSNAVMGVCEATVPLIFGPLYSILYKYTLETFPGAFFLVSAAVKFVGLCIFIWLYKNTTRSYTEPKQ